MEKELITKALLAGKLQNVEVKGYFCYSFSRIDLFKLKN